MSDFYQNGIITTLHNLTDRPLPALEAELYQYSQQNPMALVLPSLYSELERPALANILSQLKSVNYLKHIVIGLDGANAEQFAHAKEYFSDLNTPHTILWNDGPRLQQLNTLLEQNNLATGERGKGRNVWACFGYILATNQVRAVALHDCDITTYDSSLLARLIYPVAHPQFQYKFCKGYYARVANGTLNGRVSRLLVTPLVRALKIMLGPNPYLDYLDSFRYPLAGEFSLRTDALRDLRLSSDWGLEVGVLSEMWRNHSRNHICQVDIAELYDHKHQPLSVDQPDRGLSKMSCDIAKSIYRKLATRGVVFSQETFRTLKATYYRVALDCIESYYSDALINGLKLDRHGEEQAVELFAHNVLNAGEHFLTHPRQPPFIPSWNRVISAIPNFLELLQEAVEEDNRRPVAQPYAKTDVA